MFTGRAQQAGSRQHELPSNHPVSWMQQQRSAKTKRRADLDLSCQTHTRNTHKQDVNYQPVRVRQIGTCCGSASMSRATSDLYMAPASNQPKPHICRSAQQQQQLQRHKTTFSSCLSGTNVIKVSSPALLDQTLVKRNHGHCCFPTETSRLLTALPFLSL